MASSYDYPTPDPPSHLDVMEACEVLLRAGYTAEALSVLYAAQPEEVRALQRRTLTEQRYG